MMPSLRLPFAACAVGLMVFFVALHTPMQSPMLRTSLSGVKGPSQPAHLCRAIPQKMGVMDAGLRGPLSLQSLSLHRDTAGQSSVMASDGFFSRQGAREGAKAVAKFLRDIAEKLDRPGRNGQSVRVSAAVDSMALMSQLRSMGLSNSDIQRGVMENMGDLQKFYNSVNKASSRSTATYAARPAAASYSPPSSGDYYQMSDKLSALGMSKSDIERGLQENGGDMEKFYDSIMEEEARTKKPAARAAAPASRPAASYSAPAASYSAPKTSAPAGGFEGKLAAMGMSKMDITRGVMENGGDIEKFYESVMEEESRVKKPRASSYGSAPSKPAAPAASYSAPKASYSAPAASYSAPKTSAPAGGFEGKLAAMGMSKMDITRGVMENGGDIEKFYESVMEEESRVKKPRASSYGSAPSKPAAPAASYSAPKASYSAPKSSPSYSAPKPSYSAPKPSYSAPKPSYSAPSSSSGQSSGAIEEKLRAMGFSKSDIQRGIMEKGGDIEKFFESVNRAENHVKAASQLHKNVVRSSPSSSSNFGGSYSPRTNTASQLQSRATGGSSMASGSMADKLRAMGMSKMDIERGLQENGGDLEKFYFSVGGA